MGSSLPFLNGFLVSQCPSAVSLLAGKAREGSKRNRGVGQNQLLLVGGHCCWETPNSVLYSVVAMKAAGLELGGLCSLLIEPRRLEFSREVHGEAA